MYNRQVPTDKPESIENGKLTLKMFWSKIVLDLETKTELVNIVGQFGTRLQGGKDAASPRYINTLLSPLTRHIFNVADDPLLNYQKDDNLKIEPEWYMPILPMVLVNGADGIGTGWMTKIPNYNPRYPIRENIYLPCVHTCLC